MGDTEVIRQFLVSLGFQVDETGAKKFLNALDGTTKVAIGTGKAVIGIAVAAEAMVTQFSYSMEKLFFASKRTDAAVENIQGLEFGASKIGLAAGSAREALEQMTSAARSNPGMRGLINTLLGKDTSGLDQAQVMIELLQRLQTMPHYVGAQYAQQIFGMDEKTFTTYMQMLPEMIAAEKERIALNRQAGIDAQQAAAAGHEYANSIRDITARVGVLRDKLSIQLLPAFRDFNKEVLKGLDWALRYKSPETAAAGAALYQADAAGGHMGDEPAAKGSAPPVAKGGPLQRAKSWLLSFAKGDPRYDTSMPADAQAAANGQRVPVGLRQNNPGNMRKWAKGQPTANGFAVFPSMSAGLSAMAAQLLKYYDNRNLSNVRDIIATWAPKKDHNDTPAYIADVARSLGVQPGDSLNLKDPATLARLMGAMVKHEQGYNPFGTSELLAAAQSRLAAPVNINQKTDIHVSGDNAAAIGDNVAGAQRDVNADLVRNMRGAVQ